MNPDPARVGTRFALFSSGANFSCEVLQSLIQKDYRPELLVLPEYPPADSGAEADSMLITATPQRRLLTLARDLEVAYAPAPRQADFARLLERRAIDFLLVACWPYLIEGRVLEQARKAALNLHPSLLPHYRGPNPLQSQLAAGDSEFGVTLHQLDQRFDHGDIIAQAELASTGLAQQRAILERHCARRGVELFIEAVSSYPDWNPVAQTA